MSRYQPYNSRSRLDVYDDTQPTSSWRQTTVQDIETPSSSFSDSFGPFQACEFSDYLYQDTVVDSEFWGLTSGSREPDIYDDADSRYFYGEGVGSVDHMQYARQNLLPPSLDDHLADRPETDDYDEYGRLIRRWDRDGDASRRSLSPEYTPPPPPPPPRRFPSPGYLAISQNPSDPTPSPSQRKLVILDLNGTLLVRSAHSHKGRRRAYPRPYMPSFREYLFAPETCAWLDVMIWSSAQPHSVADMVQRCFGTHDKNLVAIWGRDTLGLSSRDYSRKTQTTKDLAKPWSELPVPEGAEPHSARTTLLLDDSPKKAHLQPYNHVCLKEYDDLQRKSDVRARSVQGERAHLAEEPFPAAASEAGKDGTTDAEILRNSGEMQNGKIGEFDETLAGGNGENDNSTSHVGAELQPESPKKRKRQSKKEEKAQKVDVMLFDQTLLAVIGILDAARTQSNLAGWIRAGGLWGGIFPASVSTASAGDAEESGVGVGALDQGAEAETEHAGGRGGAAAAEPDGDDDDGVQLPPPSSQPAPEPAADGDSDLSVDEADEDPDRSPRKRPRRSGALEEADGMRTIAAGPTGNDASTVAEPLKGLPSEQNSPRIPNVATPGAEPPAANGTGADRERSPEADLPAQPTIWFEHPPTVRHWIGRGRVALNSLGIEEIHGVEI